MIATFYNGNEDISVKEVTNGSLANDEVEVKISYCGICGTDLHIFHGVMDQRVKIPHIMGHECSGVVSQIGDNVSNIKIGDRVVIRPLSSCGECAACKSGNSHICYNLNFLGVDTSGAIQSNWIVPAETIHKIPKELSLDFAALIEPLAVACHDISRGRVQKGDKVVVIGGGPIGLLVSLVARHAGADVVISEVNKFRLDFAEKLNLKTVNPIEQPIDEYVDKWTDGVGVDVVFEASASKAGARDMTKLSRARGRIVVVGIFGQPTEIDLKAFFLRELELVGARVYESIDYEKAIDLAVSGDLPLKEIITKIAPMAELQEVMDELSKKDSNAMKVLIDCR
ncbi:MAG: alcohol dehydrogenase catalytic domain-containing protein [Spirochaetaceae bacterium]